MSKAACKLSRGNAGNGKFWQRVGRKERPFTGLVAAAQRSPHDLTQEEELVNVVRVRRIMGMAAAVPNTDQLDRARLQPCFFEDLTLYRGAG